jgi:hypothetical protein
MCVRGSHVGHMEATKHQVRPDVSGRCGIRTHGDPEATTAFEAGLPGFPQVTLTSVFPGQTAYRWSGALALFRRN